MSTFFFSLYSSQPPVWMSRRLQISFVIFSLRSREESANAVIDCGGGDDDDDDDDATRWLLSHGPYATFITRV